MKNFGYSMLWYWAAYIVVTLIGVLHTVFNIFVLHMKPMDGSSMGEGYEKTKPFHPLYNIVIFPACAFLYMKTLNTPNFFDALVTGVIWVAFTVVVDFFGWVVIKHPWSLSFRGFYVEYQPWITLIYLAIVVSPVIAYGLSHL